MCRSIFLHYIASLIAILTEPSTALSLSYTTSRIIPFTPVTTPRKMMITPEMADADDSGNTNYNRGAKVPILSSNLDFSEGANNNEFLQNQRRASFDRLQRIVETLAEYEEENKISLIWQSEYRGEASHQRDGVRISPINSLIFEATARRNNETKTTQFFVVVIAPSSCRVNVRELEAHLENGEEAESNMNDKHNPKKETKVSCSLVPAHRVEAACGFPPRSVPPLGHNIVPHPNHSPLRILVDESLQRGRRDGGNNNSSDLLLGGGGHPKVGCLIGLDTLLKLEGTEWANLTAATKETDLASSERIYDDEEESSSNDKQTVSPSLSLLSSAVIPDSTAPVVKPFFPLAPPTMEQVHLILSNPNDRPSPLQPVHFTFVGRINGIRRMARTLIFCDIAPPGFVGTGTRKEDSMALPWKSAVDHCDMACQLIIGKTFCQQRGDVAGAQALRKLKVGQLILVEGKSNVGSRASIQHWADKRSLDIVVFDYRLLEEGRQLQETPSDIFRRQATIPYANKGAYHRKEALSEKRQLSPADIPSVNTHHNYLKLSDIFDTNSNSRDSKAMIQIVDDKETVLAFHNSIIALLSNEESTNINRENYLPLLVGIDCEWKPNFMLTSTAESQPVLLLQISLQKLQKVYLLDLQALLRPCLDPSEIINGLEQLTSGALAELFGSPRFLKVGFQVTNDFQHLAGSYPHIPAFRSISAISEVGSIAKVAFQIAQVGKARQRTSSLARLAEYLLEKTVSKKEQISDWSNRPLTEAQLEYAALDAAVTPALLEMTFDLADLEWVGKYQFGRCKDDRPFAKAVLSVRFVFLEDATAASAKKLKAKKLVSNHWMAMQRWVTGGDEPALPSIPPVSTDPYIDVHGMLRVPSSNLQISNNPNPNVVAGLAGRSLGRSKDSCLRALLSGNPDFPDGALLDYHQRSGYVEFEDCVAMFVNSPSRPGDPKPRRGYPNAFLESGRFLTWFLRKNEWNGGSSSIAKKLLGNISDDDTRRVSAVLFVRMDKDEFLCCGRCRVTPPAEMNAENQVLETEQPMNLIELQLELMDWTKLLSVDYFVHMASATVPISESF